MKEVAALLLALAVILAVVAVAWIVLWKLVLERNPLVRDFFDLDKYTNNTDKSKIDNKNKGLSKGSAARKHE